MSKHVSEFFYSFLLQIDLICGKLLYLLSQMYAVNETTWNDGLGVGWIPSMISAIRFELTSLTALKHFHVAIRNVFYVWAPLKCEYHSQVSECNISLYME